ncbi:MAG: glycine zipper family protein [Planctomycetota bacterium]
MAQQVHSHAGLRRTALIGLASSSMLLVGCNSAGEGAVAGGFLGALGGLAIGALSGNEGDGAVIGAVSGAALGGIIGDQNERNARGSYPQRRSTYSDSYDRRHYGYHQHGGYHRDPWWDNDCDW